MCDWHNKYGLRTLSLHSGQLSPENPCELKRVLVMALVARTDTLILVLKPPTRNDKCVWLVSMRRVDWKEVERLPIEVDISTNMQQNIDLSESRVFFGNGSSLLAFDVSTEHRLSYVGNVVVNAKYKDFACTLIDANIIVAFSLRKRLLLQRLVGLQLEPLATLPSVNLSRLLFRGPLLLGTCCNNERKRYITPILLTGNGLNSQPQILPDFNAGARVGAWCIAGERLVVQDRKSDDLLIYVFE